MLEWKLGWYHSCDDYRALPFTFTEITEVIQATVNLSGDQLRLGLSNQYGVSELVFQKVEISLDEKFHVKQSITFNGMTQARIAKGTTLKSDPAYLKIKAGMQLYVKLSSNVTQTYADFCCTYDTTLTNASFVRSYVGMPHFHHSMSARRGWFCLNEIDILTDSEPVLINVTGDSLVEMGQISTSLTEALYYMNPEKIVVVNTGVSGERLLANAPTDEPIYRTFGQSLLQKAPVEVRKLQPTLTIAFVGANDLLLPLLSEEAKKQIITLEQFQQGIEHLKRIMAEHDSHLILGTILPFRLGHGSVPHTQMYADAVARRLEINCYLRSLPETLDCSCLVEDTTQELKTLYDFGDHIHLNKRGGQKIAMALRNTIEKKVVLKRLHDKKYN